MAPSSSALTTSTVAILSKGYPGPCHCGYLDHCPLLPGDYQSRFPISPTTWEPFIKAKQGINGAILNNRLFISDFITDNLDYLASYPARKYTSDDSFFRSCSLLLRIDCETEPVTNKETDCYRCSSTRRPCKQAHGIYIASHSNH